MDGVLVGAGSLWPVNRISACQNPPRGVQFARESDVAMSSMPETLAPKTLGARNTCACACGTSMGLLSQS
jgi:hypothetical protein